MQVVTWEDAFGCNFEDMCGQMYYSRCSGRATAALGCRGQQQHQQAGLAVAGEDDASIANWKNDT
jgi:hypothetical protein